MDAEFLIGSIIRGALFGGRKRGSRAHHYLRGGAGSFLNAGTLMTLAGLAWGAFESMKTPGMPGPGRPAGAPEPAGWSPAGGAKVPPVPAPSSPAPEGATTLPPPAPPAPVGPAVSQAAAPPEGIPTGVIRMIRLTISAARADGTLSDRERAAIVERASEAGIDALVEAELRAPRPLPEIVGGVTDPSMRRDLYVLAFTIVRADEQVTGAERIYLAQLASLLGLDADAVARLEADTAAQIDAQPDQQAEAPSGPARS